MLDHTSSKQQKEEKLCGISVHIFHVDERNKYDPKTECKKCKNENHLRCEGLVEYEEKRSEYTCNKCKGGNEKDPHTKIKEARTFVDGAVRRKIFQDIKKKLLTVLCKKVWWFIRWKHSSKDI